MHETWQTRLALKTQSVALIWVELPKFTVNIVVFSYQKNNYFIHLFVPYVYISYYKCVSFCQQYK